MWVGSDAQYECGVECKCRFSSGIQLKLVVIGFQYNSSVLDKRHRVNRFVDGDVKIRIVLGRGLMGMRTAVEAWVLSLCRRRLHRVVEH